MKLIITEKPSVRDNIAHTLGAYKKIFSEKGGSYCLANDEYYVAAASGHLYCLGEPSDYGYKKSFKESYDSGEIPMFPDFRIFPCNDKKNDLREFLNTLINRNDVDEIICATDAAREGEMIFREIYISSGSKKPCKRFWTSSVTEDAIKKAMSELKPLSEYDRYYYSAKARAELDWIFGMNLSRIYSVLDGDVRQVGRVMTPTLAMIADRDRQIDDFKETVNYRLILSNGAESEKVFDTKEAAERVLRQIGTDIKVTDAVSAEHTENRPLMFSLDTLQQEMNALYGMTASETLNAAQSLYEKKFTTYPRTDGEYLTEDMKDTAEQTVRMFADGNSEHKDYANFLIDQGLNSDKRIFDGHRISDHHAIIPTLNKSADPSRLSGNELKVYTAVADRFLTAFDKKYRYNQSDYKFDCGGLCFLLTVKNTLDAGWKAHDNERRGNSAQEQDFSYSQGEMFSSEISVKECRSFKPKRFTDGTLLSVMSNIDNRIDDADLKAAVKGKGIGTSATRAEIIDKIIRSGYAERKGKYIVSTQFGRDFIRSLPAQIISAERTAAWEQQFSEAENNMGSLDEIFSETKEFVSDMAEYEKHNADRKKVVNPNAVSRFEIITVGKCPRCGEDIIDKGKFYGCTSYKGRDETGCGFSFSKAHGKGWYKGDISREQAAKLLKGEEITLKTVNADGKEYAAKWHLEDNGEFVNVRKSAAEKNVIGKCPWCGADIIESKNSFSCSSYKSKEEKGCGFVLWKEDRYTGVSVNAKNAAVLVSGGTVTLKRDTLNGQVTAKYELAFAEKNGRKFVNLRAVKDDEK